MTLYEAFNEQIKKIGYFTKDEPVIIGLSGGVDSVVLFDLLYHLPRDYRPTIIAVHINHHLRAEANKDEQFVSRLMKARDIPLYVYHWEKTQHPQTGIEAAARSVRYHYFKETAKKAKSLKILTAHHKNDQIETVMMRLIRGGSLEEITGIPVSRQDGGVQLLRVLLPYSKRELINHAQEVGLEWREDASNSSLEYTRNRFRQTILPLLMEENQQADDHIIDFTNEINSLLKLISPVVERAMNDTVEITHEQIKINRPAILAIENELGQRVISEALKKWNNNEGFLVKQVHINLLYTWLKNSKPHSSVDLPNNLIAIREYDDCYIQVKETTKEADLKGTEESEVYQLKEGEWTTLNKNEKIGLFHHSEYEQLKKLDSPLIHLDKEMITLPLTVRHRKKGDKMKVKGLNGSKKIKDIFIDQKVPMDKRNEAWLVEDQKQQIIWLLNHKESPLSLDPITDTISYILVYQKMKNKS